MQNVLHNFSELIKDLKLRKSLEAELKKVEEALKMIRKSEGKKRG